MKTNLFLLKLKKSQISLSFMITGIIMSQILFTSCEKEEPVIPEEDSKQEESSLLKSTVAPGTYKITARHSGKALDLNMSQKNVVQYSYWGGNNQKWIITNLNNGYYKISSVADNNLAFDIAGVSTSNGASLKVYSYWGGHNQQFKIESVGNGYYKIIARHSGKAIDVAGVSKSNGANVHQWTYLNGHNQQWKLESLSSSGGGLKWRWVSSNVPADAKRRITNAMNAAVNRYNRHNKWWNRTLTVEYNPSVPTADAVKRGHIRFGKRSDYQNERTALHEIAHTYGVGTSSKWTNLVKDRKFVGRNANALIKKWDGSNATISADRMHFWPYGLNYNNEWSHTNAERHCQLVREMVKDGIW